MKILRFQLLWLVLAFSGCATSTAARAPASRPADPPPAARSTRAPAPASKPNSVGDHEEGLASYYATSLEGRRTASGEPYRGADATCAHRKHPFGTKLRVTLLSTGRSVECRVNDRGPFVKSRVIDLSRSLAEQLGIVQQGLGRVRVERR